jgi:hypothetical protein
MGRRKSISLELKTTAIAIAGPKREKFIEEL